MKDQAGRPIVHVRWVKGIPMALCLALPQALSTFAAAEVHG